MTFVTEPSALAQAAAQPADDAAAQPATGDPKAPAAKEKAASTNEGKSSPKDAKTKKAAKPRGRLPDYFSAVVTAEQREKIYAIQKDYDAKIDPLEGQIEALTKERNEKIKALLTPEQKRRVEDLKAAAKKVRDAKKDAKRPADPAAKPAPNTPAKPAQ